MAARKKADKKIENSVSIYDLKKNLLECTDSQNVSLFVKKNITLSKEVSMIKDIVGECFDGLEYMPYYIDIAIKINILKYFCDLKYDDVNEIIEFIYNNDNEFKIIFEYLNDYNTIQIQNILKSVNELIEFQKNKIIQLTTSVSDDTIKEISNMIYNINEIFHNIKSDDIEKIIMNLINKINFEDIGGIIKQFLPNKKNAIDIR